MHAIPAREDAQSEEVPSTDRSDATANEPAPTLREAIRDFAAIIRSHPEVRAAFRDHGPIGIWWRMILALHGKPVHLSRSPERQAGLVARGFEVYGWVFRALAVTSGVALGVLCLLPTDIESGWSSLLIAGAVPGSVGLWVASGLLFTGARAYRVGGSDAVPALVLGLVMIVLLLCLASIAAGAALHSFDVVPLWLITGIVVCAIVFGVGSYVLELNYVLVTARASNRRTSSCAGD
jgi:hypothetical protein